MQSGDAAVLVALDGPERGRRWVLAKERTLIGRDPKADVVIPDRSVSRHHAEVVRRGREYFLRDLNSTNGTYANGEKLETAQLLQDGDEIHIAVAARFRFVGAGYTIPLVFSGVPESGLRIDEKARRVWVNGNELRPPLSQAQFRLLQLLYEADGAVCTREEVIQAVWPHESAQGITEQAIDALVRRLRERLAELDPDHMYVVTVRGHGFRFENRG